VLAIVQQGLDSPGPNHMRSPFGSGVSGFVDVAVNRVPLVYAPALHDWPLTLPPAVLLVAGGCSRSALATGLLASLVINDATGFMLAGGIACAAAVAHFTPSGEPVRLSVLSRLRAARDYLR
jgi:hypothetical protein